MTTRVFAPGVAIVAIVAALLAPASIAAQATRTPNGSTVGGQTGPVGTVVVAHGGDSLWNAHVLDVARQAKTGGPVEVSFLMGPGAARARFQDVVARLEAKGVSSIVVVPMLVSSHSGHYEQIRYLAGEIKTLNDTVMVHHLHMAGIERPTVGTPIRLARAMDDAPQMARVLADRALALTPTPGERALMIVGHGPNEAEEYAAWMENLRRVADTVKARTGFRDVRVDVVRDDAPAPVRAEAVRRVRELIDLQYMATGKDVVVVPVLVSSGSVSRDKLPADIKGTRSIYNAKPLLPHPEMARWIEARVRDTTGEPASSAVAPR